MELNAAGAYTPGEPNGWREWPSYTRLDASGCYGYQVDGTNFTTMIVFRSLASAARTRPREPGGTLVGSGTGAGRAV